MNAIILSFNAVFPLMLFMLLGLFLKSRGFFKGETADEMNKMVFKCFLPMNIAESIYSCDLKSSIDLKIALLIVIAGFASFALMTIGCRKIEKDPTICPVMIQGMHKANFNLIAIPIVASFYEDIGMTSVMMAIVTPVVNICAVVAFVTAKGGKVSPKELIIQILKNPLIIATIIGIALNLSGIKIPALIVNKFVKVLATMATPVALMALGSGFSFAGLGHYKKQLSLVSVVKLIVAPAIGMILSVALGVRGANLIALLVFFGGPAAVNSYSTAVSMGGNKELAGQIVVITSSLCIITLFLWLSALGILGFI